MYIDIYIYIYLYIYALCFMYFLQGGDFWGRLKHMVTQFCLIKKKGEFTLQRKNNNSVIPLKMELSLPSFLSLFSAVQGG